MLREPAAYRRPNAAWPGATRNSRQSRPAEASSDPVCTSPSRRVERAGSYRVPCRSCPSLCRILEAEHGILIVVGKHLGVSAPAHHRAQALLRGILGHEILQFV